MRFAGATVDSKRASVTFLLAYVAITILGTVLALGIAAIQHTSPTEEPLQNTAYLLSERFLPVMNLLVWMAASWLYFRNSPGSRFSRHAVALGIFWLAIALPLDFVAFVLIKTPISLSPHDFYIGQFPWIYLIYAVVFVSPLCYVGLCRFGKGPAC
jgi:hypothetical protein